MRLLRNQDGASLVGFHDSNEDQRARVAAELGVRPFETLDELLAEIDAAVVVTPTRTHHEVAKRALERGVHLLIEKPIAATLDQADELVTLAGSKGLLLQIGHVERFNRAVRAAMPYLDQPRFVESDRLAPFNPRGTDVAVVLDLMIHDIDLVHALVGDRIEDVTAVGVGVLTPSVDIANARLKFRGGAVANITASRVSRDRLRKLRIFQRTGYISLDLGAGNGEFYRLRSDIDVAQLSRGAQSVEAFVERIPLEAPEGEPLRLEHDSFVAAINGKAPIVVTGEDGRDALAVALRIVREIENTLPSLHGSSGSATSKRA